jgi:cytochrome c oxidase cbb3-type subunit 3
MLVPSHPEIPETMPRWPAKLTFLAPSVLLLVCACAPSHAQPGGNRGAQIFATTCAGCHGGDGKGSDRGPSIATMPTTIARSDADLVGIVKNGITGRGMPPFGYLGDPAIASVVRYLRTLQGVTNTPASTKLRGDSAAGRIIYFGNGQCASCHMIEGEGGFIASDLTTYGQNRSDSAIIEAIIHPDQQIAPGTRVVEVRMKSGQNLTGVLRFEDNLNLGIQTVDGRYHFLARATLAHVTYTDHTLMPHDYSKRLSANQLDDLASFLIVTGRQAPAKPAPKRHDDEDE